MPSSACQGKRHRRRHEHVFLLKARRPPPSTLFPYTTLFRSTVTSAPLRQEITGSQPALAASARSSSASIVWSSAVRRCSVRDNQPVGRVSVTAQDRKSTRLNSSHSSISYAVFCLPRKTPPTTSRARVSVKGPPTPAIYTLSLHDALPIYGHERALAAGDHRLAAGAGRVGAQLLGVDRVVVGGQALQRPRQPAGGTGLGHGSRSEEHTSELQSQFHLVCRLLPAKENATDDVTSTCFC